jgi:hypothetical protein
MIATAPTSGSQGDALPGPDEAAQKQREARKEEEEAARIEAERSSDAEEADREKARRHIRLIVAAGAGVGSMHFQPTGSYSYGYGLPGFSAPPSSGSPGELTMLGPMSGVALSARLSLSTDWAVQARAGLESYFGSTKIYAVGPWSVSSGLREGTTQRDSLEVTLRSMPGPFFVGLGWSLDILVPNSSASQTGSACTPNAQPCVAPNTFVLTYSTVFAVGPVLELGYLLGRREEWELLLRSGGGVELDGTSRIEVGFTLSLGYALW